MFKICMMPKTPKTNEKFCPRKSITILLLVTDINNNIKSFITDNQFLINSLIKYYIAPISTENKLLPSNHHST